MRLSELLRELPEATVWGHGDASFSSVVYDSRKAAPGAIFVAIPGLKVDGHDYLEAATKARVSGLVVQADKRVGWEGLASEAGIPVLEVPDTRRALATIAAALNGHPGRRLRVIGVTGTDGKTSLCHLLDHILTSTGEKSGLVSTAECRIGPQLLADTGRFTTPEAPELQAILSQIANAGCRWAVLEATSHELAQHRLDGCEFDIAAMTTVGRDHLDFHGTPQAYLAAKGRLFEMLESAAPKDIQKTGVLNRDDQSYSYLAGVTRVRQVTFGLEQEADLRATAREDGWGWRLALTTPAGNKQVRLRQPGLFNVYNALAATAVCVSAGLSLSEVAAAIASWPGVPGRMQFIDEGQGFTVLVDFAHAPDSLRRVLELLRARCRGRIIALFGCIGEREKDRRAAMGGVAAKHADFTVVTDDNPYTEDRQAILDDIAEGLRAAGKREGHDFVVIPDRREAIAQAIGMAVDEDAVLLAGKGHETTVQLPHGVYECDDRVVAANVLQHLTGSGNG